MNTNIKLIDTHAHIYSEELQGEFEGVLARWEDAGISDVYMPNIDASSIAAMISIDDNYNNCHAMMGLHPCYVKENYKDELSIIEEWLGKRKFVAIGEIGIDLYWDKTFQKEQIDAFRYQIELAKEHKIPFVIHSRDSLDLTTSIVKEMQNGDLQGIFHCFNGTEEQANQIMDLGFYLGLGGVITYKNSGMDQALKKISLDNMVLETDSPYLAPVPKRGKVNEPSYLSHICSKLAEIVEKSYDEVGSTTTMNAKMIFRQAPKIAD